MLHPGATYLEFQPSYELAPYVKCYALLEYNLPSSTILTDHFLPFGRPYLMVRYRGHIWADKHPFRRHDYSTHHIAGQLLEHFYHYHSGDSGMLGIFFHPSGFHRLYGLPMTELTQNNIDVEDLFGNEGEDFVSRITSAASTWLKINICETMLRNQLKKKQAVIDSTDWAIQLIQQDPRLQIDEVCAYFNVSPRHLRRNFKEKVGIGPKYYLRICRLHRALQLSYCANPVNLQDLGFSCGYFDQSHFCNDFQQFTGKTPFEYFKKKQRHLEVGGVLS